VYLCFFELDFYCMLEMCLIFEFYILSQNITICWFFNCSMTFINKWSVCFVMLFLEVSSNLNLISFYLFLYIDSVSIVTFFIVSTKSCPNAFDVCSVLIIAHINLFLHLRWSRVGFFFIGDLVRFCISNVFVNIFRFNVLGLRSSLIF
jgi:hypothetical protein